MRALRRDRQRVDRHAGDDRRRRLGPATVVRMGVVALIAAVLILLFYKELLVSSFDAACFSWASMRRSFTTR